MTSHMCLSDPAGWSQSLYVSPFDTVLIYQNGCAQKVTVNDLAQSLVSNGLVSAPVITPAPSYDLTNASDADIILEALSRGFAIQKVNP